MLFLAIWSWWRDTVNGRENDVWSETEGDGTAYLGWKEETGSPIQVSKLPLNSH